MVSQGRNRHGEQAAAAGDRIKALLTPLETVCRYRESRSDDTANFDVNPRNANAMALSVAIAPGGINVECAAFAIKELAVEQADFAVALVAAVLAGRVRQVRRLGGNGEIRAAKAFVRDADGRLLFRHRRIGALAFLARPGRMQRIRYAAYA